MYQVIIVNTDGVVTFYNKCLSLVISRPDNLSHSFETGDKYGIYFCIHLLKKGLNKK